MASLLCSPLLSSQRNFQPTPYTSSTASCPCIFPSSFPSSCSCFSFHFLLLSSSFQHTTFPADVHFFLLFLDDKRKIPTRTIHTIKDRLKKGKKAEKQKAQWNTVEMKRVDKFTILVFTSVIFDNLAKVSSTWLTRAAVQSTSTIALIRKQLRALSWSTLQWLFPGTFGRLGD